MINNVSFNGRETLLTKPAKKVEDALHQYTRRDVLTKTEPLAELNSKPIQKPVQQKVEYFPSSTPYLPEKETTIIEDANKALGGKYYEFK